MRQNTELVNIIIGLAALVVAIIGVIIANKQLQSTTTVQPSQTIETPVELPLVSFTETPTISVEQIATSSDTSTQLSPFPNMKIEGPGKVTFTPNGGIQIEATEPTTAYFGDDTWHNYKVDLSFTVYEAGNDIRYGVIFRKANDCEYYYVRISPVNSQNQVVVEILKYMDCYNPEILSLESINLYMSDFHSVSISIDGASSTNIAVTIDGQRVTATDSISFIYSGNVGLHVEHAIVRFEDLHIEQ